MRKSGLVLCFILASLFSFGQDTLQIRGVVTDTLSQPLSGASIRSGRRGTLTDQNGRFEITVTSKNATLEISSVGFLPVSVKPGTSAELSIQLVPSPTSSLSDVVVVGVQRQNKRTTIAAISGVSSKDIENRPAASVDALLQGRVAGLNVQLSSGEPGVAPTVVVRGNSRVSQNIGDIEEAQSRAVSGPLYVIDGIPVDPADISSNGLNSTGTNFLAGININDIESVTVQRDALATAAWGSRGANGVIYINTKKGNSRRPIFMVNIYGGVTQRPRLLPTLTGQAERAQKMQIARDYATTADQIASLPQLLTDSLNPYYNNATDWQELFYRNGIIKNADISMSGSNDFANYRVSAGYYDEQGVIKSSGYQRYSLRGNFGFTISPKLNSQLIVGLTRSDRERGAKRTNSDANTPFEGSSQPSSFFFLSDFDKANYTGLSSKLKNDNTDNLYSAALTVNYKILPSLQYILQGSANIKNSARDYFLPSNIDAVAELGGVVQRSRAEASNDFYTTYFWSNNLNWFKKIETKNSNFHQISATVSHQYNATISKGTYLNGYGTPSNDIRVVSGIAQQDLSGYSFLSRDALVSVMGQLEYNFNGRYLLYGSYRGDGSSRFGANNKWGYFPAAGVGWIVSDEKFFSGLKDVVNFFKIRASYGLTGLRSGDFYAPFNTYAVSGTYGGETAVQPSFTNGLTKNDLTWAKSQQKNLGFDVELFKSRITVTADVYDRITKDDFYSFTLPDFTGYTSIFFNARDLWVSNRGLDLTVTSRNLSKESALQWNTQFIMSFNKNVIARLPNNNRTFAVDDAYGISRIYAVGQPAYTFFQMQYRGVYNREEDIPFNPLTGNKITYFKGNHRVMPGDPIWIDVNGDGDVWSDQDNGDQFSDRVPTGDPNPRFTGGFNNDFVFKNFSLNISCIYTYKRTVVNSFYQQQLNAVNGNINSFASSRLPDLEGVDYWTPAKAAADPNYRANFPSINPFAGNFYQYFPFTDMFNVDGSYFKVKQLLLNYRLPSRITDKLKVYGINVYGNATNLLILKNKHNTMPDPELVDQIGVYTGGLYPQPKIYTLGVNVQF